MPAEQRVEKRVANYTKFWQKDSVADNDSHRDNRKDQYTEVVNGETHANETS